MRKPNEAPFSSPGLYGALGPAAGGPKITMTPMFIVPGDMLSTLLKSYGSPQG